VVEVFSNSLTANGKIMSPKQRDDAMFVWQ
jgi:hypothetical protein